MVHCNTVVMTTVFEKDLPKKIVLIEDEDDVRESIKLLLVDAGYDVKDSPDALEIFDIINNFEQLRPR